MSVHDLAAWVPLIVVVVALIAVRNLFFVNVGPREIAIKERRYLGKRMPPGRVVATSGEIGIQAAVLKPGLHFLRYPLERVVTKAPLVTINSDQIGVVYAVDGEPLGSGEIFARDISNVHNNFQDPIAFLTSGGQKGTQLRILPPGLWPIHPYLFKVSVAPVTVIPPGKVGVVTARDGKPLGQGRLLAQAVEGHDNYQDPEKFLSAGGQRGPQVQVLTPGTYRIMRDSGATSDGDDGRSSRRVFAGLFEVQMADATTIAENEVGLVEALDGAPLDPNDYVAPSVPGHNSFQEGEKFINANGQRGPQQDLLLPGTYYVNPMLFRVVPVRAGEIKPGEVAVIVSNVGKDITPEIRQQVAARAEERLREDVKAVGLTVEDIGDPADRRLDQGSHEAYVVPQGYRGIQEKVVGPGKYYVNTLSVTPIIIPTTNQTVEWTSGEQKGAFNPFEVISKDGFTMQLEVRVVFRVKPEDAPFMVAKIGSIGALVQNVMHPLIDSIFRNQASESSAMAYLQNRHQEQERAEARVRAHLLKYHVDVVNVLICHIHLPADLMATQTEKVLAEQRQTMYVTQRNAQQDRIQLEKTTAEADNQAALMKETVGVEVSKRKADQRKAEADGDAYYTRTTGFAEAEKISKIGEAQGVAYQKQADALGPQGVAIVETLKVVADGKIKITPDILSTGGGASEGGGGSVANLLLLNLFKDQLNKKDAA